MGVVDSSEIYLISSGCSYSLNLEYIRDSFSNDSNQRHVNHHHIGVSSASMSYTKDVTINHISYLLKNGVPAENIILFTNITQIGRMSKKIPVDIWYYLRDRYNLSNEINYSENFFKFYDSGFVIFDNNFYTFFNQSEAEINQYPKIVKDWFFTQINAHQQLDFITHAKNYLEDIVLLQTFLKEKKIKYHFYFMNNTFEGWYFDGEIIKHRYSSHNDYELPNLKSDLKLSDLDNSLKSTYELLDFDNFIVYKSEKNNFGGLDEYCTENYPKERFLDHKVQTHTNCMIGFHPDDLVGKDFEKQYLYPHWYNFYTNLIKNS